MRPHTFDCRTSNRKSQNGLKPDFSQLPERRNLTLEGMLVEYSPCAHPQRVRQTQGVALVVVLLSAMVLMVSMLAITSTMVISSQRTTADQASTLQAQYAAEAGLARASGNLSEIQTVIEKLAVPTNQNANNIEAHVKHFCDKNSLTSYEPDYDNWTPDQKNNGIELCVAAPAGQNGNSRYSLFTAYTPSSAYPNGAAPPGQYWRDVFAGDTAPVEKKIATDPSSGAESWYRTGFGLAPTRVLIRRPPPAMHYSFAFTVASVRSTGEVRAGTRVVATRTINKGVSGEFYIDLKKDSFSKYALFRNQTTSTSGGQLYFAGGETFDGPVHTNGKPGFYKYNGTTPKFLDTFTSATEERLASYIGYNSTDRAATFVNKNPVFGVSEIPLPTNNNNQMRAAFGGDETDDRTVSNRDLRTAWNIQRNNDPLPTGVYYSKGNGSAANAEGSWLGGIHVQGNVDQLKLCNNRNSNLQIIAVKQGSKTTTFQENSDGSWSVREKTGNSTVNCNVNSGSNANGSEVKRLSGSTFNGMVYINGTVADLSGDGSDAADVSANSQLTIATSSDVVIKSDITYTDDPRQNQDALNVLGIYSNGGSVLADGPDNRDLNVHASIMASKGGEGFGTIDPNDSRGTFGGRKVQINLLGGIIEDQSQTVGNIGNGGYSRNYKYDRRFKTKGLMPPFFPTQKHWTPEASAFSDATGVWQTVAGY